MSSDKEKGALVGGEFMRIHEVARKLNISQVLVRRLMREGKLPGFKVGRVWLVLKSELENYLQSLVDAATQDKSQ